MTLSFFPLQTALQSEPVWRAFLEGVKKHGFHTVENSFDADAAVIWSVLWKGRLLSNKQVYDHYRSQNKPVFIIEVGSLKRGVTWKVSLNNITAHGIYGQFKNLDLDRPKKLGISLGNIKKSRKDIIMIATQHQESLQWQGLPSMSDWLSTTVDTIRKYTDRPIAIRPHPRSPVRVCFPEITTIIPTKLPGSYDIFDIDYDCHCVINHNSGVSIQSVIAGTPVICDTSSLAYPMSGIFEKIEEISLPDREDWFLNICHTEWTVEEIAQGIPFYRLLPYIKA
jgi:hypothetical protein